MITANTGIRLVNIAACATGTRHTARPNVQTGTTPQRGHAAATATTTATKSTTKTAIAMG